MKGILKNDKYEKKYEFFKSKKKYEFDIEEMKIYNNNEKAQFKEYKL